jgi:GDSL-like Lipase/Acylhydrolase family
VITRPIIFACALAMVPFSLCAAGQSATPPLEYTPLATPCRAVDTRTTATPVLGGTTRTFSPFTGGCNISVPVDGVIVYAVNVTVVPHEGLGYLTVWPSGETQPTVSLLNSYDARTKANAALVKGGTDGTISVFASNTTDFILDVTGYFSESPGMVYIPVTPCRIIDTRTGVGGMGVTLNEPPQPDPLVANQARTWEIAYPVTVDTPVEGANTCNLPYDVSAAYSLNVTVVPQNNAPVWFTSVWGADAPTLTGTPPQPQFSNLNVFTGTDTANAVIVNGASTFTAFADVGTDLVVDVTGWFAPANLAPEGLAYYALPQPCRALDTRQTSVNGQLPGAIQIPLAGTSNLPCPLPSGSPTPAAFVLNATVVPDGPLGFLTLWPDGQSEPVVSTLNANDGYVTSNMAIVGTGPLSSNPNVQAIQAGTVTKTDLILDENGFFAANPTAKLPTVVFIGDDTTANWPMGDHPNWINRGVAGDTTDQMLARFQTDVIDLHPDVVHILGGTNDAIQEDWQYSNQCGVDTCANIGTMAQMAYDAGIRVVIGTPLGAGNENEEIDISELDRQLRLNQGIGAIPYLLDYARDGGGYAAMTALAEAEVGLAAGEPLVEAHAIREIVGPAPR